MVNYVCDVCGKIIGNNKKPRKECPKYEIYIRTYHKPKHDGGKLYACPEYVDICDECQEKIDAALNPIFEKTFNAMGEILKEE